MNKDLGGWNNQTTFGRIHSILAIKLRPLKFMVSLIVLVI